jgi:lycopene beta-cyclase
MPSQATSPNRVKIAPDLRILGAGLSGLVTAWRALSVNDDLIVEIIEASDQIGGDHTWSFNETDITPDLRDWFAPFVAHKWDRYDVRFPKRERTLEIGYRTGNSDTLRDCVKPFIETGRLILRLNTRVDVSDIDDGIPTLDATGYQLREDEYPGWQKFVGHVIKTAKPHGVDHPVIMDATVQQIDGYRFIYLLPFSETELLVEDTYFSDSPTLSENEIAARVDDYIQEKGWADHRIVRREKGVLPMIMATDRADDSAKIGLGGGFAVAATGFTVPHAVEVADIVAKAIRDHGPAAAPQAVADFRKSHIRRERYARLLNRMFFRAAMPERRYIVLQRFYGLNDRLIRRFYRNGLRWYDKARILIGKPPVPVSKALANLSERRFMRRERAQKESS